MVQLLTSLQLIAQRQAIWSKTANLLKRRLQLFRTSAFGLTVLGALLAMLASQLPEGKPRLFLAGTSAVLFAIVSLVAARFLGQERTAAWIRSRAASEALKREAYKYLASASPYTGADRDAVLHAEREKIEAAADDLVGQTPADAGAGSIPQTPLSPDEYVARRIDGQVRYLNEAADKANAKARMFKFAEFSLAAATAVITAIVGVAGKDPLGWGFDFVALSAVLTTISGAVLAHIEAQRYEFTVVVSRATARRLSNAVVAAPKPLIAGSAEWSDFVTACEQILSDENGSWVAKWTKENL